MKRLLLAAALLLLPLSAARAADAPAQPAKDGEWQQVDGGMMTLPGESIPASNLVGAAYGFIWLMVAGFVVTVWRRQGRLDEELRDLRARIAEAERRSVGR